MQQMRYQEDQDELPREFYSKFSIQTHSIQESKDRRLQFQDGEELSELHSSSSANLRKLITPFPVETQVQQLTLPTASVNVAPSLAQQYRLQQHNILELNSEMKKIANRIAMMSVQQDLERRKIKNSQQRSVKIYRLRKEVEAERQLQQVLRAHEQQQRDEVHQQALRTKQKNEFHLRRVHEKLTHHKQKEANQLKISLAEQEKIIKKAREQTYQEKAGRCTRVRQFEQQNSTNIAKFHSLKHTMHRNLLERRVEEEKQRYEDFARKKQQLEQIELQMIQNLHHTRNLSRDTQARQELVQNLPLSHIESYYPKIASKFNPRTNKLVQIVHDFSNEHQNKTSSIVVTPDKKRDVSHVPQRQAASSTRSKQRSISLFTSPLRKRQLLLSMHLTSKTVSNRRQQTANYRTIDEKQLLYGIDIENDKLKKGNASVSGLRKIEELNFQLDDSPTVAGQHSQSLCLPGVIEAPLNLITPVAAFSSPSSQESFLEEQQQARQESTCNNFFQPLPGTSKERLRPQNARVVHQKRHRKQESQY